MLTQVDQRHTVDETRGRRRHQHLTSVSGRHQARRPIHCRAEIVTVTLDRLTSVQSHPYSKSCAAERGLGQHALGLNRGGHSI